MVFKWGERVPCEGNQIHYLWPLFLRFPDRWPLQGTCWDSDQGPGDHTPTVGARGKPIGLSAQPTDKHCASTSSFFSRNALKNQKSNRMMVYLILLWKQTTSTTKENEVRIKASLFCTCRWYTMSFCYSFVQETGGVFTPVVRNVVQCINHVCVQGYGQQRVDRPSLETMTIHTFSDQGTLQTNTTSFLHPYPCTFPNSEYNSNILYS